MSKTEQVRKELLLFIQSHPGQFSIEPSPNILSLIQPYTSFELGDAAKYLIDNNYVNSIGTPEKSGFGSYNCTIKGLTLLGEKYLASFLSE